MKSELTIHWLIINASFISPWKICGERDNEADELAYGFFKEMGITANSEESAKSMLLQYLTTLDKISPSLIDIEYQHVGVISHKDVQREIYEDKDINNYLLQSPYIEGIWYSSGCGFYNDKSS
jgi:hypothetical protein